ncbi:hypothetical protein EMIT040CA3_100021 [Bacillus pseudomycoides]
MWNLYKHIAYLEKGGEHKMEVTDVRLRRVNTEGKHRRPYESDCLYYIRP